MKTNLRVHSVSTTSIPAKVEFEGNSIHAVVDCYEVELISGKRHGGTTLRFVGNEIPEAMEVFKQDGVVSVTFEAVETESKKDAA